MPAVGDQAPDFSLPAANGSAVTLASLHGQKVVLYFYPKDDTPGCTTEAIAFTSHKAAFDQADAVILGVSKDSIKKHQSFAAKHGLGIMLGSDKSGEVLEKYGVWVEKSLYGRKYMGIERATFLIDRQGRIAGVWHKVKVKGHAEEVLAAAQKLD